MTFKDLLITCFPLTYLCKFLHVEFGLSKVDALPDVQVDFYPKKVKAATTVVVNIA